jgi:exonuclease III
VNSHTANTLPPQFTVGTLNIHSGFHNKADQIVHYFNKKLLNIIILTKTKTFLEEWDCITPYGFTVLHNSPSHKDGPVCTGGVAAMFKTSLAHMITLHETKPSLNQHLIHITLQTPNETKFTILGIYAPHDNARFYSDKILPITKKLTAAGPTLVIGDFNACTSKLDKKNPKGYISPHMR